MCIRDRPIYNARHIFPSLLLNGSYEDFYAYPALSFLAYIPFVAIGIGSDSFNCTHSKCGALVLEYIIAL